MLYKNPKERCDVNYVFDYLSKININWILLKKLL